MTKRLIKTLFVLILITMLLSCESYTTPTNNTELYTNPHDTVIDLNTGRIYDDVKIVCIGWTYIEFIDGAYRCKLTNFAYKRAE